jgi:tRNA U55 pseudouridine synthase TruB
MVLKWKEFEMKARSCKIHKIEILDYNYPTARFKALVSAWTYIRSIAYDLGNLFWTWWYVIALKRTKVWDLDITLAQNLDTFDKSKILDVKKLFEWKKFIKLGEEVIEKLNMWIKVRWKFDYMVWDELFVCNDDFITNIVEFDGDCLLPKRRIK